MLMIVYRMSMMILTFISLVKMTSVMKVACRRSTIRFTSKSGSYIILTVIIGITIVIVAFITSIT